MVLNAPEDVPVPEPEPTPEPEIESEPEELPEFDERMRQDFLGLTFVGKVTHTFRWLGHDIRIRTLTTDEELACGMIMQDYVGTRSEIKSFQVVTAAACVETIDGQALPLPLGPPTDDTEGIIRIRFDWARVNWYPVTIDQIYSEYRALENRVYRVVEEMGKASSRGAATPG